MTPSSERSEIASKVFELNKNREKQSLNIVHVASEVKPFSDSGGLAAVTQDLPIEQAKLGHKVTVVSPWYNEVNARGSQRGFEIKQVGEITDVPFDGGHCTIQVGEYEKDNVKYLFIKSPEFERDGEYYGHDDDAKRFAKFCRAAPEVISKFGIKNERDQVEKPDMIHCHDWQAGHIPTILKYSSEGILPKGYKDIPTTYTIHRAEYSGPPTHHETVTQWLRLPGKGKMVNPTKFGDLSTIPFYENGDMANPVWGAMGNADIVNTVSPNYATELKAEGGYAGLDIDKFFNEKLIGILNGVDMDSWNPTTLAEENGKTFSVDDMSNKAKNKEAICKKYGQLDPNRPTIGVASRMEHAKGMDKLAFAMDELVEQGWNVIVGGKGHTPEIMQAMDEAAKRHPENVYVHGKNIPSKEVFAGADATLIPSFSEPCGLTQMEAQTMGCIPIVRATGGLKDTVNEADKTGFAYMEEGDYQENTVKEMLKATAHAMDVYKNDPEKWQEMQKTCMQTDHSWKLSAEAYLDKYRGAIQDRTSSLQVG